MATAHTVNASWRAVACFVGCWIAKVQRFGEGEADLTDSAGRQITVAWTSRQRPKKISQKLARPCPRDELPSHQPGRETPATSSANPLTKLFSPLDLGPLRIDNRIIVSPMCQYSSEDGCASDWHIIHLGNLAISGAGLLLLEATAVEARGRISHADLGLWNDETERALARVLAIVRTYSRIPIGVQLAHAGRKASVRRPWEGGGAVAPGEQHGWQTISASDEAFKPGEPAPTAASRTDIDEIVEAFVGSARRADRLGLDAIELHGAHGYLLHQFLSPLSNHRTDDYGGSLENRMRLALRVFDAVRAAFPSHKAVGMRVSASDWVEGGWDLEQTIALAKALDARGCDFIDVSSGGNSPLQKIAVAPGYQVPFAAAVKKAVSMPVVAVGLITDPQYAEEVVASGEADAIALARGILYDPRWPWHAAAKLGGTVTAPSQYLRCEPADARGLFRKQ
jgi:2,4-dienoyl-CoA reductase-like NADH-dependent reductase (Old Yellow Enzyme family)